MQGELSITRFALVKHLTLLHCKFECSTSSAQVPTGLQPDCAAPTATSSIPVTTERVQISQQHNPRQVLQRKPPPLAPDIISTSILPQFPPATTGSGTPFGYPFCLPFQFPTSSASFSECTLSRLTQHAPPQAPMESFQPTDGPGHPAVSYFQPQAPIGNFQPRLHSLSPPTSSLLPVPNVAMLPHQIVQQDALHRTRLPYAYGDLITMSIKSSSQEI